jgi:hypothetical protein
MRDLIPQIFLIVNDSTVGKHGEVHEPKPSRLWKSFRTPAPSILIKNPQQEAEGNSKELICAVYIR